MDTEKASQEDNSIPMQPKWALCRGSQPSSQNRKRILKPILTILLLGVLALSTFQAIRSASLPNVGGHFTDWIKLNGNLKLHSGDMVAPVAVDEGWLFNAFPKEKCLGTPISQKGSVIQSCEQINSNQTYASVSVPLLSNDLRICFYPDSDCSKNPTAITMKIGCTPANAAFYLVKFRMEEC
ncbi:MAG: hypothetical protein Q9190_001882 [Brigantiaea leucoxantha]